MTQKGACILCGSRDEAEDVRPGLPVLCRAHIGRRLAPFENFTEEEARAEGIKRVSVLSGDLGAIRQEGLIAHAEIEYWEQRILPNSQHPVELYQYVLDVIAAKRAYLSAFD
jgi:hypothetical protein